MEIKKTEYNHYNYDQINTFFDSENKKHDIKLKEYNANVLIKYAIIFFIVLLALGLLYFFINFARWLDSDKSRLPKTAQIMTDKNITIDKAYIEGVSNITINNATVIKESKSQTGIVGNGTETPGIRTTSSSTNNVDIKSDLISDKEGKLLRNSGHNIGFKSGLKENKLKNSKELKQSSKKNNFTKNSSSDGINQEYVCNSIIQSGDNKPKIFEMKLPNTKGNILFKYQTYDAKDLLRIVYENKILFDTGCVGTKSWKSKKIDYEGNSNKLDIHILPNCLGTEPQTKWEINSICN